MMKSTTFTNNLCVIYKLDASITDIWDGAYNIVDAMMKEMNNG